MAQNQHISPVLRYARLLDSRFRIPGTRIRFGLDGIIGLIPGLGDLVTTILSLAIVVEAVRLNLGGAVIGRMLLNLAIDFLVGSIPVLGDAFDVAFKANLRNVRLLEQALPSASTLPDAAPARTG